MARGARAWAACALALALAACGGKAQQDVKEIVTPPPPPPPPPPDDTNPVVVGDWTYYGTGVGVGADVQDVSADEGGNVYVAGGDALYVKKRQDERFLRFDSANAGLTVNCNDPAAIDDPTPATPFYQCRIISVAGAAPGKAIIGFEGFGDEATNVPWYWVMNAGGADVVEFDPAAGTLSRTRHVLVGSPPHVVCASVETTPGVCPPDDWAWNQGRRIVHKILRIVVNHDPNSGMYGDAWLAGNHGTFSALLHDAAARGWVDATAGYPDFADAKDVWEHLHPVVVVESHPEWFVNGDSWALSIDPRNGMVWGSNQYRTAWVTAYTPNLAYDQWWIGPQPTAIPDMTAYLDVWPDPPEDPWAGWDAVRSISHCANGTAWVASTRYGLAQLAADGTIVARVAVPDRTGGAAAVACDPWDGSAWVGLASGGVVRYRNGAFEPVDTTGAPAFATHPVQSIQLDRWTTPRILYFAFTETDAGPGGVGAYDGP